MKFDFIASNQDVNVGSFRIWIRDLRRTLISLGHDCLIHSDPTNIRNDSIAIFSKGDYRNPKVKEACKRAKLVGAINVAAEHVGFPFDFIVVGSIEEQISLSAYPNVLIYPLIELDYQDIPLKEHVDENPIKICFHGHYPHLNKFNPYLCAALEEFSKKRDIELHVITGDNNPSWKWGRPNIPIVFKRWSYDSFVNDVSQCDIGIVPNVTELSAFQEMQKFAGSSAPEVGLYSTDYMIRFKNKSNAGRAFVFHQLGIPVIGDLTPSNFHVMGDPSCGLIAHNVLSWLNCLERLSGARTRNLMAANAYKRFNELYDPVKWGKQFTEGLRAIETHKEGLR